MQLDSGLRMFLQNLERLLSHLLFFRTQNWGPGNADNHTPNNYIRQTILLRRYKVGTNKNPDAPGSSYDHSNVVSLSSVAFLLSSLWVDKTSLYLRFVIVGFIEDAY